MKSILSAFKFKKEVHHQMVETTDVEEKAMQLCTIDEESGLVKVENLVGFEKALSRESSIIPRQITPGGAISMAATSLNIASGVLMGTDNQGIMNGFTIAGVLIADAAQLLEVRSNLSKLSNIRKEFFVALTAANKFATFLSTKTSRSGAYTTSDPDEYEKLFNDGYGIKVKRLDGTKEWLIQNHGVKIITTQRVAALAFAASAGIAGALVHIENNLGETEQFTQQQFTALNASATIAASLPIIQACTYVQTYLEGQIRTMFNIASYLLNDVIAPKGLLHLQEVKKLFNFANQFVDEESKSMNNAIYLHCCTYNKQHGNDALIEDLRNTINSLQGSIEIDVEENTQLKRQIEVLEDRSQQTDEILEKLVIEGVKKAEKTLQKEHGTRLSLGL